jgi:hypothetical protein
MRITCEEARAGLAEVQAWMQANGLTLNPELLCVLVVLEWKDYAKVSRGGDRPVSRMGQVSGGCAAQTGGRRAEQP